MEQVYYLISDASKAVNVESHVLRYWEEELKLPIRRNELGHRYYTKEDLERFMQIKRMKDQGLQLKAIKGVLDGEMNNDTFTGYLPQKFVTTVHTEAHEDKGLRLQTLLKKMISETMRETTGEMLEEMKESILKEMDYQFRIMEDRDDKRDEEYYSKLDELIRIKSGSKRSGKSNHWMRKKQEEKEKTYRKL